MGFTVETEGGVPLANGSVVAPGEKLRVCADGLIPWEFGTVQFRVTDFDGFETVSKFGNSDGSGRACTVFLAGSLDGKYVLSVYAQLLANVGQKTKIGTFTYAVKQGTETGTEGTGILPREGTNNRPLLIAAGIVGAVGLAAVVLTRNKK